MTTGAEGRFGRHMLALPVMVGVAVGLGNVWRFPYMMGRYGGGAFLLLYILCVILFGVPALAAEWALGRTTGEGPPGAYIRAGLPGGRIAGGLLFLTVGMATAYYVVVIGWLLLYLLRTLTTGLQTTDPASLFDAVTAGLGSQIAASAAVLALCAVVLLVGVRKGIARVSSIFVPVFFLLMVGLVVRSVTLPGAEEGLHYLLAFDFSAVDGHTLLGVVGQTFFSLGLGGTFMVVYGAYLDEGTRPLSLAAQTATGDLLASLLAAFLVIPAVFAAGLEPTSGPPLLFQTLPVVFAHVPGGDAFAAIFFIALGLVAFLSALAAVEALVAALNQRMGWTRRRAIWTVTGAELLLGIPSMASIAYLEKSDLVWGSTMQPLGSLIALIAVGWSLDRSRALAAAGLVGTTGIGRMWYLWIRWVVPIGVVLALLSGWLG